MSHNQVSSKGVIMILSSIKALHILNISHSNAGDDAVMAIRDCLRSSQTFQTLNISYNKISKDGAKIIAETLQENQNLQNFDISGNDISEEGLAAFCGCLKIANKIAIALEHNKFLQELHLHSDNLTNPTSFNRMILNAV